LGYGGQDGGQESCTLWLGLWCISQTLSAKSKKIGQTVSDQCMAGFKSLLFVENLLLIEGVFAVEL
jgi:hypothetical protein